VPVYAAVVLFATGWSDGVTPGLNFLAGLHGAVALALLGGLLFTEEAGVPLPFAPGELTLLAAGLLIAAGGLDPYIFIPLALLACIAGSLVGYTWARAVGDRGLQALARRIHQQRALERVSGRIRSAGWGGVAVSRLIPGLRIYTTLVAGAVRVRRSTFFLGIVPAAVIWIAVYVALGVLVGVPIEHFFTAVQKLAIQGAILVVMGVGCYFLIRRTPASSGAGLVRVPRPVRVVIAAVLDIGVVASVTTGLLALGRLLGFGLQAGWVDPVVALLVVAGFYVVIARRSSGATVGEALLQTSYATGQRLPLRPRAALQAARSVLSRNADELTATSDLLRTLSDPERLRIVSQLLEEPRTIPELATLTRQPPFEVRHQLERLSSTGALVVSGEEPRVVYVIRPDLGRALVQLLAVMPTA
jgi:membrane protein DedA with SNARE-associated domain/DNA-binding transcriptional ArsR family regulator